MENEVYVELRNITTGQYYYVCYPDDLAGIAYNPQIREHLAGFDIQITAVELFDKIRPVVDRLRDGNSDCWHVYVFQFNQVQECSLTQPPASGLGLWEVGDICIVNGARLPTKFHVVRDNN